jgi:hypothetical protein
VKGEEQFTGVGIARERFEVIKNFFGMFFAQALNYSLISYNFRNIATGNLNHTIFTTFFVATMAYVVIKRISQKENSILNWLAYSLGGVVGNILGIQVSKLF